VGTTFCTSRIPASTAPTWDFGPFGPGNLRADYVLPSADLLIRSTGIFWPTSTDPLYRLTGPGFPAPSSDHRAVWVDVKVPGASSPSR